MTEREREERLAAADDYDLRAAQMEQDAARLRRVAEKLREEAATDAHRLLDRLRRPGEGA